MERDYDIYSNRRLLLVELIARIQELGFHNTSYVVCIVGILTPRVTSSSYVLTARV